MDTQLFRSIKDSIRNGDIDGFRLVGSNPDSLRMSTGVFGTWLHMAAEHGQLSIVKELLGRGLDINARGGIDGGNALNAAASEGQFEVARYLLDAGAEMDVSEPERNPLFAAIMENDLKTGKLLIDRGIDWTVSYTGDSMKDMDALAFAKERGAEEFVRLLQDLSRREQRRLWEILSGKTRAAQLRLAIGHGFEGEMREDLGKRLADRKEAMVPAVTYRAKELIGQWAYRDHAIGRMGVPETDTDTEDAPLHGDEEAGDFRSRGYFRLPWKKVQTGKLTPLMQRNDAMKSKVDREATILTRMLEEQAAKKDGGI